MFAYCMNNPVRNSDNEGEWAHIAVGAAIGAALNVAFNYVNAVQNGKDYSLGEGLIDAFTGAVSGGLAASGFGKKTQALIGGAMSAASAIAKGIERNEKVSLMDIGYSFATGAISGYLGGDGVAKNIRVSQNLKVMASSGASIFKPNKMFCKAFNSVSADFALSQSNYMAAFTISNILNVHYSR